MCGIQAFDDHPFQCHFSTFREWFQRIGLKGHAVSRLASPTLQLLQRMLTPQSSSFFQFISSVVFVLMRKLQLKIVFCKNSYNKTTQMHQFLKFICGIKLYMFRTVPLSIIRSSSLYTQQWYMSYRFADSLRTGSGRNVLILLASSQQTCMTYTIAVCTVKNS